MKRNATFAIVERNFCAESNRNLTSVIEFTKLKANSEF